MIEGFRTWVSALLCIGIFISILELIIPKSKIKKYIYVLVGVVTLVTIVSPGIQLLQNEDIAKSVSSTVDNLSNNVSINEENNIDDYKKTQEMLIKEEFIASLKKDIESKLTVKGIAVKDITISISENYDIQKVEVKIKKLKSQGINEVNQVIDYLNQEYDIDYSKIEVVESGE